MCLNGFPFLFFNRFKLTVSNILSMTLLYLSPASVIVHLAIQIKQHLRCPKHPRHTFLRVLEVEVQDQGGRLVAFTPLLLGGTVYLFWQKEGRADELWWFSPKRANPIQDG